MITVDRLQHVPSPRELDDLELLGVGGLGPLIGFGHRADGITLVVPDDIAGADQIELLDPEGAPRGFVSVEATYPVGDGGWVGIAGPVELVPEARRRPFADLYVAPSVVRDLSTSETVLCVVDAPPTVEDLELIHERSAGRPVVFLVLAGARSAQGITSACLLRTAIVTAGRIPGARVVAAPVARRSDPQQDASFRERVARAYAPGDQIVWAAGTGECDREIARLMAQDRLSGLGRGLVVFFTGLSGSGKSTLASALADHVLEAGTRTVSLLDGDRVRRNLSRGLSFSREDRDVNVERIGWVAAEVARHGGLAICSPIAPFDLTRRKVRGMVAGSGSAFVLVHVSTSLAECERRDRKGLYARARRGEIPDFTGISSPYEQPTDADIVVDAADCSVTEGLDQILDHLIGGGLLATTDRAVLTVNLPWEPSR